MLEPGWGHTFIIGQPQFSRHICQGGVAGYPRGLWIPRSGFKSRPWPLNPKVRIEPYWYAGHAVRTGAVGPASFFCGSLPLEAMQLPGGENGAVRPRRHLLIALALVTLLAVPAAGITLTVLDRSVEPNGSVVVSIAVADAEDLGGVDLVLVFDPAVLRFESASPGSLAERSQVLSSENGPGRIAIAVASPRSVTGTGPFLALIFTAVGSTGARSPITLEPVRAVTVDGDTVPVRVVNGLVSVGGSGRTPLSPFAALGALAVAAASFRTVRRSRRCS